MHLLGVVAGQTGRNELGEQLIRGAIALVGNDAAFHANLGLILSQQGRRAESIESYRRAIALRPSFVDAHYNLGIVFADGGRLDEAIAAYGEALRVDAGHLNAHNNLGNALWKMGRIDAAIESYRRALALKADHVETLNNLAVALGDRGRFAEARTTFGEVLRLRPEFAEAWNNLGKMLKEQGRLEEALPAYRRAIELKPAEARMRSNLVFDLHGAWGADPAEIFAEHRRWDERHGVALTKGAAPHANDRDPARRLRVGYVSPDFREHSVAFFLEALLEGHDRSQVEVFCYADLRREDGFTGRMRSLAAHWRPIYGMADAEVAAMIRRDAIDILVDLAGHTAENRLLVFARKPAPVQVSWLGYCDTTGLTAMDYRLTDAQADPPGTTEHLYTEKLVRLPAVFACFRPHEASPPVGPLPALARGQVTFGSFHKLGKLNDALLERWAAILKAVPGSRLLMVATGLDEAACRDRYAGFFQQRGVEAARLEFRGRQTLSGYLALHGEVDVMLDCHPFTGHTVSSHALWMGVPVVTLSGATHWSRMVASVLQNLGHPEWIAATPEAYVRTATELAADLPRLAEIRAGLRASMAASPLTDGASFARNVEHAFREMWRAWCAESREKGRP
jgi:predicted O-linked N-acetylglucosamine transferase (SPINDLY family)